MCVAACWKGWAEGDTAGRRGCHGVWLIGCQWQPIYTTGNTCMLFVVSFSFNYGLHYLLFTVYLSYLYTHTCSHTFNGPLSGTTQVSQYQKGKTNLDFTGARDNEWQWHQLGHMQVFTSLQTDNHASISLLKFFLQAGCPSCRPTNSVKALKED